jgi:hypothetical protein
MIEAPHLRQKLFLFRLRFLVEIKYGFISLPNGCVFLKLKIMLSGHLDYGHA